jgi:hypothetical protein
MCAVKRPPTHVTDAKGERQMRQVFEDVGWGVNDIQNDYGIDFDVQVFDKNEATGEWFKVQLKSSENTQYSKNGDFIAQPISEDHARHYSEQLRDPIFVLHADVKNKRTCWYAPQLSTGSSVPSSQETVTLKIPVANSLPETLPALLDALNRVRTQLGARALTEASPVEFAKGISDEDRAKLIQALHDKADVLQLNDIVALVAQGKNEQARLKIDNLLANSGSSTYIKFNALLHKERLEFIAARRAEAPQVTTPELHLRIANELRALTKEGPPSLKLFALIALKAAELETLAFTEFGVMMNLRTRSGPEGGSPFIRLHLATERLRLRHKIIKKYNQCVRLARYAGTSKERWALPHALLKIVSSAALFIVTLRIDGETVYADQYTDSALQIAELAAWIAERTKDNQALLSAALAVLPLAEKVEASDSQAKVIAFSRNTLTKIKDPELARSGEEGLGRAIRRMHGESIEGDPTPDINRQIVENLAASAGINITDPNDPAVKLIEMGLKDANPERAIKHCTHAFVSMGRVRAPFIHFLADLVRLPSIGPKIIHCDLHDYAVEAQSLDDAAQTFKDKFCNACKDVTPRPDDWRFSDEWQEEENKKHSEFMDRFDRKYYGRRGKAGEA